MVIRQSHSISGLPTIAPDEHCNGITKRGTYCQRTAGWGTKHSGTGRCRRHGGNNTNEHAITTGRYSIKKRQAFKAKLDRFYEYGNPFDLREEIAYLRTLMQDMIEKIDDPDMMYVSKVDIDSFRGIIDDIGKTAERYSRIVNSTALTAAEIIYFEARILDMIGRYVEPERQLLFIGELKRSVGDVGQGGK